MKHRRTNIRIYIITTIALLALFFVVGNVFMVTIMGVHKNSDTDISLYTNTSNTRTKILEARRGFIYDKNGNIIAEDETTYNVYAVLSSSRPNAGSKPAYVVDKVSTAQVLSTVLGGDFAYYITQLSQDKYQVEFGGYGRNISIQKKEELQQYDLPGIEYVETISRNYPIGEFSSHIIGFAQYDAEKDELVGKMGIEGIYNEELTGTDGYRKSQVNTEGYALPGGTIETVNAEHGSDVYLTLDKTIQLQLQSSLQETMETWNAERAWGAVMEVETGKIIAYDGAPTFDPNILNIEDYTNIGMQYAYEPGSTMKTFTYAAAIDSGVYNGEALFDSTTYYMGISNGVPIRISGNGNATVFGTINNARNRNWGMIDYDTGYRYSSNVGIACLLTNYLSTGTFNDYLEAFHFFEKVGVTGFSEVAGYKNYRYPIEKLTMGFGQGSSLTMIQLLQAYSAIFNDGIMVKPYLVQEIRNSNTGEVEFSAETEVVGHPIKESTAKQMQKLMYDVINTDDGSGKYYRVADVAVIGKTGTAQLSSGGAYSEKNVITSVALGFPADDPKIMVYYAFQAAYDTDLHYKTNAITSLVKTVAVSYGLTTTEEDKPEVIQKDTETYTMENMVNHSLLYSYQLNAGRDVEYVILGDGDTVLDQYPNAGTTITSGQRIFLLTSSNNLKIPNLAGYSRKEVMALWKLCGLAVAIDGDGQVVYQSIPEGTLIYSNSILEVTLE